MVDEPSPKVTPAPTPPLVEAAPVEVSPSLTPPLVEAAPVEVSPSPITPLVEAAPVSKPEPTPASKPIAEKPESVLSSTTSPAASKEDVKKQQEEFKAKLVDKFQEEWKNLMTPGKKIEPLTLAHIGPNDHYVSDIIHDFDFDPFADNPYLDELDYSGGMMNFVDDPLDNDHVVHHDVGPAPAPPMV